MSRSNPHINAPNPATRWYDWNGEKGLLQYYDKEAKRDVDVALPFAFLLLDELASVRGWHEASKSGIYSNEVRDTRTDILVVKAFKGGVLAEGLYKDIKDRVCSRAIGGSFSLTCYIAFKHGDETVMGAMRFRGAALGAWMEFRKAHRADLYNKAVFIAGYAEGQKGRITFRVPTFGLKEVSKATNNIAVGLDAELQAYLTEYFKRRTSDQTEPVTTPEPAPVEPAPDFDYSQPLTDDDIPF